MELKILTSPWFYLALALAALASMTKLWLNERDDFASFRGSVAALGKAAEQHRSDQIKIYQQRKELADAENARLTSELDARTLQLRNANASIGRLSAAPAGSKRPDLACYDRAELERAYGGLVEGNYILNSRESE